MGLRYDTRLCGAMPIGRPPMVGKIKTCLVRLIVSMGKNGR